MFQNKPTSLIAATVFALAASPVVAELRYTNSSGGDTLLYGQFNPAGQFVDDGVSNYSTFVDNSHSNSRVGLWVTQPYDGNIFTFNFETALGFRQSDAVSQTNTPQAVSWSRTNLRKIDFALRTVSAGKFYAGQGSMATDGVADGDYSGTALSAYNSIGDTAGSFQFRTAAGALSGISIGSVMPNLDGGRRARVRYDTPNLNGFLISLAAGKEVLSTTNNNKYYDIALRYVGEFGGTKVQGAVGFSRIDNPNGAKTDDTIGSFSVLFASGFNLAIAAGSRKQSGNYGYGKIGYIGDWFSIGPTAMAIDYYDGNDFSSVGSKSKAIGVGVAQKFDKAKVEAYIGYRKYQLADNITSYLDASSVLAGARWKF